MKNYFFNSLNRGISIMPHPYGNGFQLNLKNGCLDIPDDDGCYVVSTGCGSGKTESIKSLIAHKYEEGIVYCVDTKVELMKMYWWLLRNLCVQPGCTLSPDDVMVLCGKEEGDDAVTLAEKERHLNNYRNNPWCMLTKKVLLVTHVRFWSGLINFFMIFRPQDISSIGAFDGDFKNLMSRGDLRKYILFDETPLFIKPFCVVPRPLLAGFVEKNAQNGMYQCKDINDIFDVYNTFYRGTTFELFKESSAINKLKLEVVLGLLPSMFPQWFAAKDDCFSIIFAPAEITQQQANTHVIIFEGAGDILFGNNIFFRLLDIQNKYNVHVNFHPFKWGMKRKENYNDDNTLRIALQNVKDIIRCNIGPTLIVVWRNLNCKEKDCDFVEWIRTALYNDPDLQQSRFSVTYYGAADTKSTNDYRDYENIVLCGSWSMPESDTSKFRRAFLSDITNSQHRMWYYVQLISRIGIRRGDRNTYNVYMSDDYCSDFVNCLNSYFNNNLYQPEFLGNTGQVPEWQKKLDSVQMRSNHRDEILCLCNKYPELQRLIYNTGIPQPFSITLKEISQLVPRAKYERARYDNLVLAFKALGVDLIIT